MPGYPPYVLQQVLAQVGSAACSSAVVHEARRSASPGWLTGRRAGLQHPQEQRLGHWLQARWPPVHHVHLHPAAAVIRCLPQQGLTATH